MRLACITIDLDPLRAYTAIHGLGTSVLDERARRLVPEVAVPRFLEIFARSQVRATFFAVGQDLEEREEARAAITRAAAARHEIASHSYAHDHRMSEWSLNAIALDLARARQAIGAAADRPAGFRAPGYNISPPLLAALAEAGYAYDSSVLPSVPYYLARGAAIGLYRALGQPSGSIMGRPEAALAPTLPYRVKPGRPFLKAEGPLMELPISVLPYLRVPFIGTLLAALPERALTMAYRAARGLEFLNFELHAIDLLDVSDGIPAALARRQRDARFPAKEKARRLAALVERIADDYEVVPMVEAAQRIAT